MTPIFIYLGYHIYYAAIGYLLALSQIDKFSAQFSSFSCMTNFDAFTTCGRSAKVERIFNRKSLSFSSVITRLCAPKRTSTCFDNAAISRSLALLSWAHARYRSSSRRFVRTWPYFRIFACAAKKTEMSNAPAWGVDFYVNPPMLTPLAPGRGITGITMIGALLTISWLDCLAILAW